MTKEEMLDLIRKDRPEQVIHEVISFIKHPLFNYGIEYEAHVVMETPMFLSKIKRVHMKLPYPVKPYNDLQKKWETQPLDESLKELNDKIIKDEDEQDD
jgi:hypothetical protein